MTLQLLNRLSKPREGIEGSFSEGKQLLGSFYRISSGHPQTDLLPIFIGVKGNSLGIERITFPALCSQKTLNLDNLLKPNARFFLLQSV